MVNWNVNSRNVSEFVDKFLDRALGASNDPRQRVPVYNPLPRKYYVGKLLPRQVSASESDYKMKIAPCSYIVTFIVEGQPQKIQMTVIPSFNIYFRTGIHKSLQNDEEAETDSLSLYSLEADPQLPAQSGRDDMWVDWRNRVRAVGNDYKRALDSLAASKNFKGRKLRGKFNTIEAVEAYIRKRYCTHLNIDLSFPIRESIQDLDLAKFRNTYECLGSSPEWLGQVEILASSEESNTRITVYLTNMFSGSLIQGDPNWYDTHLQIKLAPDLTILPIPCPVLSSTSNCVPEVYAEARNCTFDEINSTSHKLIFSPIARTRTNRRKAHEVDFTFQQSSDKPRNLLEKFSEELNEKNSGLEIEQSYRSDIDIILSDDKAVSSIGMVAQVYAKSLNRDYKWRFHQLALLIRLAAMYICRERGEANKVQPIVLNVPTAGGKTEAFFAAAMFCAFYEKLNSRRSVNIIKYPMKLLSSDQVIRLSRYSMVADEIANMPLGIGYMVGQKGQFEEPNQIIEVCPYPDPSTKDNICGAEWLPFEIHAGVPTLKCKKGHKLHLGIDNGHMLTRQCPAFIVAIWDKFVSQSTQRRLSLLFGADRYYCSKHGFLDFADTNQSYNKDGTLPSKSECYIKAENSKCGNIASKTTPAVPGIMVFDEGHLIRESDGTLDSHFETTYLQIAQELTNKSIIPIVSTATIAGIGDFLRQLGLIDLSRTNSFSLLPEPSAQRAFFSTIPDELQHETIALVPFDVMLTWAMPDLLDIFFETLASDYNYDATQKKLMPPEQIKHLRQVMVYCSSYKNISALGEMNRNVVATNREKRGRNKLQTLQLSSKYFDRIKAQRAIEKVKKVEQQIIYATNIASIGIDIENLDVIFFFGLPSNVSEFIQAMNRTGRREGRSAICVAVLGPNKERDMSYYRYWSQFIKGVNQIVEPIPINRFASSAINRTFNNVTTALILMYYAQKLKRRFFSAGEIFSAIMKNDIPADNMIAILNNLYRSGSDPAQEYEGRINDLWNTYLVKLRDAKNFQDFPNSQVFGLDWMWNLRSVQQSTKVVYPELTDLIERAESGQLVVGDIDTTDVTDLSPEDIEGEDTL